ncbi:MAG: hypothetical protein DA408_10080 [Bacteroidetes bacterium]|nr:MAG: hypothetical protein C7N36_02540 [Bacteroidota bacterium]PTM12518.1 MAG: hypothetical protein DA408_10080 [Bacteroidota bacterium]
MSKLLQKLVFLCFFAGFTSLYGQNVISMEYQGQRNQTLLTSMFGPFIQNGVKLWRVTYTTPDVFNQLDTASGLLVVPFRDEVTIYPTLVYQHGTVDGPQDVPSNLQGGYELAMVFGGLGYATLAPDFLGAGTARGFHPYVHAATEASAAVDMLRAVRAYAPEMDLLLNDQLFVTGYSQGGHASMALHQVLEQELSEEFNLTAASHMSGPYSISDVMREVILSEDPYNFVAYLPNTYLSYNYVYGIYSDIEQIFKPAYVPDIQAFYEGTIGLSTLNNNLIAALVTDFGAPIARNILQDSILAILENPDLDHPLHEALRDNDTYLWASQRPTRLMYCMADDQVNFRNSVLADSVMNALGAFDLDALNVNPAADHGGCVSPAVLNTALFFGQFAEWVVDTRSGIPELAVTIFPNPVQDRLQIMGLKQTSKVLLLNQMGQAVFQTQAEPQQHELRLPALPAGVYWLKIQNTEGLVVKKIILEN